MAYTAQLENYQSIIWQDEGDAMDAILVKPQAQGNLTWCSLQQREDVINLNLEGVKALIKELQWFIKNQELVIEEFK